YDELRGRRLRPRLRRGDDQGTQDGRIHDVGQRYFAGLQFAVKAHAGQHGIAQALAHQVDHFGEGVDFDADLQVDVLARRRLADQHADAVLGAARDQGIVAQLAQGNFRARLELARRPDQVDRLLPDDRGIEAGLGHYVEQHSDIQPPRVQPFQQMPAHALDDAQRHLGHGLTDRFEQRADENGADRGGNAQHDLAEGLGAQRHDFLPGLLELPQDIASVLEQQRALRRGLHALLAAGEQAHAELIFQVAHVAAERRLGNVQGLRGMREAADFERLDEIPQLPAIHTEISICDGCVANYRL